MVTATTDRGWWILHLSGEPGFRGGERQLLLLARGLSRWAVDQVVAAPADGELFRRARELGLETLALHSRTGLDPRDVAAVRRLLSDRPGAILHAHTSATLSGAAVLRRLASAVGVVHTRRRDRPCRRGRRYTVSADRYAAVSRAVAERLLEAGLEPSRLRTIRSAVDPTSPDDLAPTDELRPGRPTVLCVGDLSREKGQTVLVESWRAVLDAVPDARLVLVGDGRDRREIERRSAAYPSGSVVLPGRRDEVGRWLRACDVYAQPSRREALGTSVLDAMALRVPVVASRVGGLPEAVADGVTGLLVPVGQPAPLGAALVDLLGDADRRREMGAAGRRRVEELFGPDAMVRGYLDLYRQVADDAAGGDGPEPGPVVTASG